MRLNYDTFTGRRSVFVLVAFLLILLGWGLGRTWKLRLP